MAGANNAMFLFEVVVGNVKSMVESRHLLIKSDFADVFSLELKDPKTMHIVIPEPPPLPPEPPGKKGKKKPPKPKKGKKGKGVEEAPPPEPVIQSGQSILFSSNAEFIIQTMKKFPLELSLWSKEDNLTYIGGTSIPWDPAFILYLEKICNCEFPPPITISDDYNIFEEGKAKLMAKIGLQIKLTYLSDKLTTAFRTLSEDSTIKKVLYTGINSKTTSYMCTLKTTDEEFEENCNKIENNFVIEKPKPNKIVFADYKNAPGANLTTFNDGDFCCRNNADKPPESIYKAPETCPDIDFIIDYVRKIIVSCNDNMRMLTPRPTIHPRIKATDIDRLCYCKQTNWPEGAIAERFKNEAQSEPCPMCSNESKPKGSRGTTFDLANLKGPCGKTDCKIARELREYIENLIEEENKEIDINDIIGPCGSKECRIAEKIQEFLRHEGVFTHGSTLEGLSTQCGCIKTMQKALTDKEACDSSCSKDCAETSSDESKCDGSICPYRSKDNQVYDVYYFTVEYDFDDKKHSGSTSPSGTMKTDRSATFKDSSRSASPSDTNKSDKSSKYKYCSTDCPSTKTSITNCSKSVCSTLMDKQKGVSGQESKCQSSVCPNDPPSPADSEIEINLDNINNPCCVKTCDVAEKVKDFIVDGISKHKDKEAIDPDQCFCDCDCNFKLTKMTTYCAVCGGYECLGDDVQQMPAFAKPHPCPIYHKMYDKKIIQIHSPWSGEEEQAKKVLDVMSIKSSRTQTGSKIGQGEKRSTLSRSMKNLSEKKIKTVSEKKTKPENKKVGKFTANVDTTLMPVVEKRPEAKYPYPQVPKTMGWNWTAEDIPGLKPRPKWKPGAAHKILVRRYRAVREGVDIIAKKKRAMLQRKKKTEMKPTLVVKKQNGDYTVQMEVLKKYSKERLHFQYPYDDKPPIVYTIGKTLEEQQKIQKQRERRQRRETRKKSTLLQSTFRDRCQEICVKAFNQAMGVQPLPNPNDPECPCHTESVKSVSPPIDSCSCSDEDNISSSDTDDDEWVIEFTPPIARWDVKAKHPLVLSDNECQYSYLDYKVKLLDKQGNPVPRFFKGPDGKQECSDLGGFWAPNNAWLEINKDGYIGPDGRWVPMNFTGPDGMFYSAEEGFFTDSTGQNLTIGVDGYIDKDGKWAWYSKSRGKSPKSMSSSKIGTVLDYAKSKKTENYRVTTTEKTNIKGNKDQKNYSKTKSSKSPSPILSKNSAVPNKEKKVVSYTSRQKSPLLMSVSVNFEQNRLLNSTWAKSTSDDKKLEKYKEIMKELEMYDGMPELRGPGKTNRASNTSGKGLFTLTRPK